jgi:SAM-dependent methyltransferase
MDKEFKEKLRGWLWPLVRGWPDEGRQIVQGPALQVLLDRATKESSRFRAVFNAGAGECGYSRMLLDLPGVVSLVESDFEFRFQVPKKVDPRQVFFCASLTEIPLTDRTFDLVLCTEVLEHIQEDQRALSELGRVMTPRGWLLISVPTPPALPDPAHVREGYRREELAALLAKQGFEVVDSRFCMYFFFRLLLKNWSRLPWCPRILVRTLSALDRLIPIGPPMDLMILARRG